MGEREELGSDHKCDREEGHKGRGKRKIYGCYPQHGQDFRECHYYHSKIFYMCKIDH